jgi:hypothetical protein
MANQPQVASTIPPISLDLNKAEVVNPDGIRPTYSNNAAVLLTPHDFRVIFSEVVMTGPSDTHPEVEMRANITMAPTQFKALAAAISQTLAIYERQFGEITWPPKNQ